MDFFHRLLLRLEPERAHDAAIGALRAACSTRVGLSWIRRLARVPANDGLSQNLLGRTFANPVGLAAGFDKNARAVAGLAALGFGFVEVGTATPRPQPGNPKPRIFRHARNESLQNALGFNNDGMEAIAARLARHYPFAFPLGVNIGKNATTALERAESDYERLFEGFANLADYFVVNVSSPNTPGLRDLQSPERIAALVALGRRLTDRPVLVKLSPDLDTQPAVDVATAAVDTGAAGIVLTNTTTRYELIPGATELGGLSGRVLRERSFEMLQALAPALFGRAVLISVGGVDSGSEVYRRLRAGASLVQIYTALVYRGPRLVALLLDDLLDLMRRDGYGRLDELIGADLRRTTVSPE